MATFKESSKIELEIEDDDSSNTASVMGELEVETEDGDLEDSEYPVSFSCASPELEQELDGHPEVEDGEGDFDTEISLTNDVAYNGCEVSIGDDLYVALPLFKVQAESEDKEEEEEDDDDENEKRDKGRSQNAANNGRNDDDDNNTTTPMQEDTTVDIDMAV